MISLREMIAKITAVNAAQKTSAPRPPPVPLAVSRERRLAVFERLLTANIDLLNSYAKDLEVSATKLASFWARGFSIEKLLERVKQKADAAPTDRERHV